ncbi:unnamed protein product, partial [Nesidiocoris tenuis]
MTLPAVSLVDQESRRFHQKFRAEGLSRVVAEIQQTVSILIGHMLNKTWLIQSPEGSG